jgi:hypothetical protein
VIDCLFFRCRALKEAGSCDISLPNGYYRANKGI